MKAQLLRGGIVVAVLAISLSACASNGPGARSAVEASAILGTWTVDATFASPEQPFVDFAEDGTWSASDGCNRVLGTWELETDGTMTTTAGPSTLIACDGAQLPLAVALVDYVQLDGETLVIHSSEESTVTELVRTDDPTVGPAGLPIGQWVESDEAGAPFLTLAADGSATGDDGCNRLIGTWELADDGAVTFGPFASTLKFCEGVETWLGGAALGRIQGGVMTLQDASGTVLGQLALN